MDYYTALFFNLNEMVIPKNEAFEKITKRLHEMRISLSNDNSGFITIICIHKGKSWYGHIIIHLKSIQKDEITLIQGLPTFIIQLLDNKLHKCFLQILPYYYSK